MIISTYQNPLSKHELSKFFLKFFLPFPSNKIIVYIRKVVLNEHCSLVFFFSFSFSALIRLWSHCHFLPIVMRPMHTQAEEIYRGGNQNHFKWIWLARIFHLIHFSSWCYAFDGAFIGDITKRKKKQQQQEQTNDPSVIRANQKLLQMVWGLEILSWK